MAQENVRPIEQITITEQGMSAIGKGMRLNEIRAAIPELEAACNRAMDATEDFTNLCKLVASKAATEPSVVKTFITARCNEKTQQVENKAEQLTILFDECS